MAMASTVKVVLGSIAFAIFWVLAVFPSVPFMPIGRTAGSLLGGMLMVIFQVMTADEAYTAIDLPILGLLFGTMVVSVYLERADMFKYLGKLLAWKSLGAKDLLFRVCLISAISSAFFTNDTACVVLTEFVLKIARKQNLPPEPFLLALASSANIGSSATPIGNPQNLVIAVQSGITFGKFLLGIFLAMIVGVFVNVVILLGMYWKVLSVQKDEEDPADKVVEEDEVVCHQFSSATMSHASSVDTHELNSHLNQIESNIRNQGTFAEFESSDYQMESINSPTNRGYFSESEIGNRHITPRVPQVDGVEYEGSIGFAQENIGYPKKWNKIIWRTSVYVITLGMLISLLVGLNMSWTAITAALALVVLDFKDARPSLEKVSYSLLIFICGMFITVSGFNKTGLPSTMWDFMEPYSRIDHAGGIAVLAVVITLLSNLASNVPTVLQLGAPVAASAAAISPESEKKAWLILAWVSTVAGNLSLLGSAANLIVCEQARTAKYGYNLSFWNHLKFGVPSTIIVIAIGLTLIR